jgi:hypothetical protein
LNLRGKTSPKPLLGRQSQKPASVGTSFPPGTLFPVGESPFYYFSHSHNSGGFPKTSVFGKAILDSEEKADFWPLFPKPFPKLTEFWEWLMNNKL